MCAALVQRIAASPGASAVWLDHFAYSGRLLAGNAIPWLDLAPCLAYYRTAQRLLKSDVAMLPLQCVVEAWLAAHPDLLAAMAGKRRIAFALKTLLAAEQPRARLAELAAAVGEACAPAPFVLVMPSPRRWLAWTHAQANALGDPSDEGASGDDIETAAMYVADFLRTFAACGVGGVLLEEAPGRGPASVEEAGWYQPVINVARHYRWDVAIESPGAPRLSASDCGVDLWIDDTTVSGHASGAVLDDAFWTGAPAPALDAPGVYYAHIPAGAEPERVLARLAALR